MASHWTILQSPIPVHPSRGNRNRKQLAVGVPGSKEQIPCETAVDPKEKGVEFWMCELEDMMKVSVRHSIKNCIADYMETVSFRYVMAAGTTSSTTFKVTLA